ncbi:hypothetical protein B0A67_13510 [Flavobacterium aquidurense]|nr:hypothetical protein B0A67_13510 [Flavobacterium aquidurense]
MKIKQKNSFRFYFVSGFRFEMRIKKNNHRVAQSFFTKFRKVFFSHRLNRLAQIFEIFFNLWLFFLFYSL